MTKGAIRGSEDQQAVAQQAAEAARAAREAEERRRRAQADLRRHGQAGAAVTSGGGR